MAYNSPLLQFTSEEYRQRMYGSKLVDGMAHSYISSHEFALANQNFEVLLDMENLAAVPVKYRALFSKTQMFAATIRDLVRTANVQSWGETACFLIHWSVLMFSIKATEFARYLHSQRESLYWTLDNALLRICLEQWEHHPVNVPWDEVTKSLRVTLANAQLLLSKWMRENEGEIGWFTWSHTNVAAGNHESAYFKESKKFIAQSSRVYELWRTMRLCARGNLPAELANVIIADVSLAEGLPTCDLRTIYLPRSQAQ